MPVHAISEQQHVRLIFDGALTIYEAAATRMQLLQLLAAGQPLEIDLNGISEIDLSGVQLLLALLGEPLVNFLPGASVAVDAALGLLDVQRWFWPQPVVNGSAAAWN